MKVQDTPMMSDEEVEIIDELIDLRKPKFCLEWGAGGSTIYFPQKHRSIKLWLAIEHNGNYVRYLQPKLASNAVVVWCDDAYYIDSVKLHPPRYDLVLVDGQEREKCIQNAVNILAPGGSILLHDAGRKAMQDFLETVDSLGLQYEMLSEGEIPVKEGGYAHRGLARLWK